MLAFDIFLKSVLIGFCVAVPIGPVGVLVIRRSLTRGWWWAFVSGLAAASADGLYGYIAAHGLSYTTRLLLHHKSGLEVAGGLLLILLGVQIFWNQSPKKDPALAERASLLRDAATAFFLMVVNPSTILIFLGLLATLNVKYTTQGGHNTWVEIVAGVMLGSTIWWLLLSAGAQTFKTRLTSEALRKVDRVAGTLVTIFGLIRLVHGLIHWRG